MIARAVPGGKTGSVRIPCSKSQAHRLLICAALGEETVTVRCDGVSKDIEATAECLRALGAGIVRADEEALVVTPIRSVSEGECELRCGESGSTLRFLLPVVGALGARAVFVREGRLPERPLAPLDAELIRNGMTLRSEGAYLHCEGKLRCGDYTLPGNVSSQYISGLLMALPLLEGESTLAVAGKRESEAYITMTEDALALSNISISKADWVYTIPGSQRTSLPRDLRVEGDWSSAAFFLCMGALSREGILVTGLNPRSSQGDRGVLDILRRFGAVIEEREDGTFIRRGEMRGIEIDAGPVPDLIPTLAAVAMAAEGETRVVNAARLRIKESDRLASTAAMLRALGGDVTELPEGLILRKSTLHGGEIDPQGDHRIAMAAAVAAGLADGEVIIPGGECVAKSYPAFWEHLAALKGEAT